MSHLEGFMDIESMVGHDEYATAMRLRKDKVPELANEEVRAVLWSRTERKRFRVEYREVMSTDGRHCVEYLFYRRDSVDPHGEFLGEKEQGTGVRIELPVKFVPYLCRVVAAVLGSEVQFHVERIAEVYAVCLRVWNLSIRPPYSYTDHLFDALDVNYDRFI